MDVFGIVLCLEAIYLQQAQYNDRTLSYAYKYMDSTWDLVLLHVVVGEFFYWSILTE